MCKRHFKIGPRVTSRTERGVRVGSTTGKGCTNTVHSVPSSRIDDKLRRVGREPHVHTDEGAVPTDTGQGHSEDPPMCNDYVGSVCHGDLVESRGGG